MISQRMKNQLLARLFTAFPALAARWGKKLALHPGEVPWCEPRLPLRKAKVALFTTGGVHLKSQTPYDMSDSNGDPGFRELPVDAAPGELTITHDYYDHRDAEEDLNLVYPVQRLKEIADQGGIGSLHRVAYSVMGHIMEPLLPEYQEKSMVEIAARLVGAGVDYVLLVPA